MNRAEWHAETVARMERAVARLEERIAEERGGYEAQRLKGKVEGVKLGLSYFREQPVLDDDDDARILAEARKHVSDSYYFGDELEHEDLARILGDTPLVDQ